jgi:hypothetical protein
MSLLTRLLTTQTVERFPMPAAEATEQSVPAMASERMIKVAMAIVM